MLLPSSFGLDREFTLSQEQCDDNDLMDFLANVNADLWSNEDQLCDKYISTTISETTDPNSAYRAIRLCFKRLSQSQLLPRAVTSYAKAVNVYWKKENVRKRFNIRYKHYYEKYTLEKEKREAANQFIKENYRVHGSLATKTAQDIVNTGQHLSDDSSKSEDHHPQRSTLYKVIIPKQSDNNGEQSKWMVKGVDVLEKLVQFRDRAVECSQEGVSALSDLRLLSLDYIYLFSRNGSPSITAYLDSDIEIPLLSSLGLNDNLETVDSVAKNWCDEVSDFNFSCDMDPYTELQIKTISILSHAVETKIKSNIIIANMIHTMAGRIHLSPSSSKLEDTHVHRFISYAIKHVFGAERLLTHNWANGHLSKTGDCDHGKFKPDYVAYVQKWRSRYDVLVAEFKSINGRNSRPPSDLVKLGQQMKIMINNIVKADISSPVVCGILVEGYQCSTYKMDLPFPGVYRMVKLQDFVICHDRSGLSSLPTMYRYLNQVKSIILRVAEKIETSEMSKAAGKRKIIEASDASWVNEGTCTYYKDNRKRKQ